MNDIVNVIDEEALSQSINLGEGRASSTISYQLAQDFYNEITGKSESLEEYSRESFVLKLHHIEQLHHIIEQSTEQYNIKSFNENYSVKYVDDCSERFSSLERFKLQVSSRGAAVEAINIQYNLLIVLPKTHRVQEYKIHIKLVSRVVKMEKMREELTQMPIDMPLFPFENLRLANFAIDYIDVSVANSLMSVIKSWFNNIEKSGMHPLLKESRKFSFLLPRIFKYGLLGLSTYNLYLASLTFVSTTASLHSTVIFLLFSSLIMFISYKTGIYLGRKAEFNLDSIYVPSYISFSGADENFVAKSEVKIKSSRNKVILAIASTILLGSISSILVNYIIN